MNIEIRTASNIEKWTALFQHLEHFGDNVSLMFYGDRFYIQTMDKSRLAVCEVFLPSSWFDFYVIHPALVLGKGGNKYLSLGVNVALMSRILKIMGNRTLLEGVVGGGGGGGGGGERGRMVLKMKYVRGEDVMALGIRFLAVSSVPDRDQDQEIQSFGFELPLVYLDDELMTIPVDTDYTADLRLNSDWVAELVKTLRGFGDTATIDCSETEVAFSASGVEQGTMRVPVSTDKLSFFAIEEGAVVDMSLRLKYLFVASLFHKMSREVVIRMTKGRPLQVVYFLEPPAPADDEASERDPDARLVLYLVECCGDLV